MLAPGDLAQIAEVCRTIGDQVTDESGFIPVRSLLARFHTELHLRPLLVEGMIASLNGGGEGQPRWAILINSEKYPVTLNDVAEERGTRPLPYRMRNTVAHELVHALAFRANEFGVRLKTQPTTKESLREFVEDIERQTENLSPLLLWSEKAIRNLVRQRGEPLTLADVVTQIAKLSISRYVFINRLKLIRPATDQHDLLFSAGLRNVAIGVGVWGSSGAYLKGWPLFYNFDDGMVPAFLRKIAGHEKFPANQLFTERTFALCGGPNCSLEFDTPAGTRSVPDATRFHVQIATEEVLRKDGEEFFFVARKTDSR